MTKMKNIELIEWLDHCADMRNEWTLTGSSMEWLKGEV